MNTIGWIVTSSSRSGTRGIERRLRQVNRAVSRPNRSGRARVGFMAGGVAAIAVIRLPPLFALWFFDALGRVSGEGEESVIERRPAQSDLIDADTGLLDDAATRTEVGAVSSGAATEIVRCSRNGLTSKRPSSSDSI